MNVRPHVLRAAAAAVVLAPFAISVAAHVVPDRLAEPVVSERPPLAFGEYLVNLGRLPEGRPATGLFRFRNTGAAPLKIVGFAPSCGCLKPRIDKFDYAPGESGAFSVQADTANEASDREDHVKQHYVDVRYDAGKGEQTARVHLKFVLPARHVTVEPRSLLVYQFDDKPVTREITIIDRRTPPVTITAVECPSTLIAVENHPAESAADPIRAKLTVTVPGSPGHDIQTLVRIRTDDEENPTIYVPIGVFVKPPAGKSPDLAPADAAQH